MTSADCGHLALLTLKLAQLGHVGEIAVVEFLERDSGNFLYVALHLVLDLEKEVITYASRSGLPLLPQVHPRQLAGIAINPYAQELAQVVVGISFLQWKHHNGFTTLRNPVLGPVETIRRMVVSMTPA